jgi:maleamate amidohydrolase
MAFKSLQPGPRVWDKYLSEQDKAAVAKGHPRTRGFGERPALLLIDLYRWVFGDKPQPLLEQMDTWPGGCGLAGWEAIPHIQKLLVAARAANIPIIHTTGADSVIPSWAGGGRDRQGMDAEAQDRYRRRNDIIDEVAPIDGELVIHKDSPSAFWGTPLVGQLIAHGIDTVLVGGESTSGCVRASVVDGCTSRLRMMVVEECCFDRHEATHAIDLFTMDQKYADVVPLEAVLKYLDELQESTRS